jgi:hypothetical protein
VISRIIDRARGLVTEDLVLSNIVVVKGFYVNIMSEARLLKASV